MTNKIICPYCGKEQEVPNRIKSTYSKTIFAIFCERCGESIKILKKDGDFLAEKA